MRRKTPQINFNKHCKNCGANMAETNDYCCHICYMESKEGEKE